MLFLKKKFDAVIEYFNALQIEYVELIPESKVIMMNGKFHIVTEDKDELTRKVVEFMRASHKGTEWEA